MIRKYLNRRTRNVLQQYVAKDALEAITQGKLDDDDCRRLIPASIELVIAEVDGPAPEVVSERMGQVADIASKHGGVVVTLISSIVIIAFGMLSNREERSGNRFTLAKELAEQLATNVKIIHCARDGVYGNVGNLRRMSYGFVVPRFVEMMGLLASMKFGETRDLGADPLNRQPAPIES